MIYNAEDIQVLRTAEVIRKRPGMYLGDLGRLGVSRLIGLAVEVLASLTVNRERVPYFSHHAFLDVVMDGCEVSVFLDYNPDEASDFPERCASLIKNRNSLQGDEYTLVQGVNSCAPLPILSALSSCLHILKSGDAGTDTILSEGRAASIETFAPTKEALVVAHFVVRDLLDPTLLSQDYLEGFLHGVRVAPGLIVRSVKVRGLS